MSEMYLKMPCSFVLGQCQSGHDDRFSLIGGGKKNVNEVR